MTTILVNDNKMYGDGQMTGQHISSYKTKKIVNFGSAIVGGAGRWASVVKFHQWVYENLIAQVAQEDHPLANIMMPEDMVEDDFMGLVLYQDGTVVMFEGCKNAFEHEQPVAIGSGADFAIACAHNGLDGKVAIETAAYFDTGTGGEIQVESFEEEEPIVSVEEMQDWTKEEILAYLSGEVDKLVGEVGDSEDVSCPHNAASISMRDVFNDVDYELTIFKDGNIYAHDDEPMFTKFEDIFDEMTNEDVRNYARLLDVKFPNNILPETLAKKIDVKIQSLVDELNQ